MQLPGPPLRDLLEQHARLSAAPAAAAAAARPGSAAQEGDGAEQAPELPSSIVPGSWQWLSLSSSDRQAALPLFSVEVVITGGQGPTVLSLELRVPPPAPGAAGAGVGAGAGAKGVMRSLLRGGGSGLDLGVVHVPVDLARAAMRPDGYRVRHSADSFRVAVVRLAQGAEGAAGSGVPREADMKGAAYHAEMGSGRKRPRDGAADGEEDAIEGSEGGRQAAAAAASGLGSGARGSAGAAEVAPAAAAVVVYEVTCREEELTTLEVQLESEEEGVLLGPGAGGEFRATCATLPGWEGEGRMLRAAGSGGSGTLVVAFAPPRLAHTPEAAVAAAAAVIATASRGRGVRAMHRMVLEPASPSVAHVLPLELIILVTVRQYTSYFEAVHGIADCAAFCRGRLSSCPGTYYELHFLYSYDSLHCPSSCCFLPPASARSSTVSPLYIRPPQAGHYPFGLMLAASCLLTATDSPICTLTPQAGHYPSKLVLLPSESWPGLMVRPTAYPPA